MQSETLFFFQGGHTQIIEALLKRLADINTKGKYAELNENVVLNFFGL